MYYLYGLYLLGSVVILIMIFKYRAGLRVAPRVRPLQDCYINRNYIFNPPIGVRTFGATPTKLGEFKY